MINFSIRKRVFTPVFILRVACAWVSEFRLFLTHICLLETKEIHSLLCIKFSRIFSNVYDKTCSAVIMQPSQDGSEMVQNYIVSLLDSDHHFLNHKLSQFLHKKLLKNDLNRLPMNLLS